MIKLTTSGHTHRSHYVAADNIASIAEAGTSSQWHGIRSIARCFDGQTLEVSEKSDWIAERVAEERGVKT